MSVLTNVSASVGVSVIVSASATERWIEWLIECLTEWRIECLIQWLGECFIAWRIEGLTEC